MNIEDFARKAQAASDEGDAMQIDSLCWRWLNDLADDSGTDGDIAKELMALARRVLD